MSLPEHEAILPRARPSLDAVTRTAAVSSPAIEVEHLTKRFRPVATYRDLLRYRSRAADVPAVEDISFDVRRGELFGLLGENGAGKSTLIRMLSTSLLPTAGRARVAGFDVVEDSHAVRRVIGLVSGDERSFYWRLTGRQNLRYFAALYRVPSARARSRTEELLDLLGIQAYGDQRYGALSSGTRQKFAIARGMLTEPDVLFLDEPTRALDPIAADELREHIADHIVGTLGRTVILATHTLAEAEAVCSRVAILRAGKLVELGTINDLTAKHHLRDIVELELGSDAAAVEGFLRGAPGVDAVEVLTADAPCRIAIALESKTALTGVLRRLLDGGQTIHQTFTRRPTLADIYRRTYAAE